MNADDHDTQALYANLTSRIQSLEDALRAVRAHLTQPVQTSGEGDAGENRAALRIIRGDCAVVLGLIEKAVGVQS